MSNAPRPIQGGRPTSPDRGNPTFAQLQQMAPVPDVGPTQLQSQPPQQQQQQQLAAKLPLSRHSPVATSTVALLSARRVLSRALSNIRRSLRQQSQPPSQSQPQSYAQQVGPGAGSAFAPGSGPVPYAGPRSQRSIENMRGGGAISPNNMNSMRSINGVVSKMDSPANAPQDGFHYGRATSPSGPNGFMSPQPVPAELDALRKREAWYKASLALAVKKGFVEPDQLNAGDIT